MNDECRIPISAFNIHRSSFIVPRFLKGPRDSRINTNVSSLIAQRVFRKNSDQLNQSLQRLSTGLKINTGADNPAGLIASENLRAEKVGISTAIDNAQRASNIIGTAEGGLNEVSSLLNELQSLVSSTAFHSVIPASPVLIS